MFKLSLSCQILPCLAIGWLILLLPVHAKIPAQQRLEAALSALQNHNLAHYRQLAAPLTQNILYPYLEYTYLKQTIKTVKLARIKSFLHQYDHLPISRKLRHVELLELAHRKDWPNFLHFYRTGFGPLSGCYRVLALQATHRVEAAKKQAYHLWMFGYRQPPACNAAFALLQENGHWPEKLVWQRTLMILEAGNITLAREIIARLPPERQPLANRLLDITHDPDKLTRFLPRQLGSLHSAAAIVTASLSRYGQSSPGPAHALWQRIKPRWKHDLSERQKYQIERNIALYAAVDRLPQGLAWLRELPTKANDRISRSWRVRATLRLGNWKQVLLSINAMPRSQQQKSVWRYWRARALLAQGRKKEALAIARPLFRQFSYYGFLAADLWHAPYSLGPRPPAPNPALQKQVKKLYLARLALALHEVHLDHDAAQIWRILVSELIPGARVAAARLAQRRQWFFAAYTAAAQSPGYGLSTLTFPLAHHQSVTTAARATLLPINLILAVMRQESAFQSTVCSDAGACGLLQLLPSTACWIGKRNGLGVAACRLTKLRKPRINILVGSTYLAYLMGQFTHNLIAAIAAYNAGSGHVRQWLDDSGLYADTPRWVATLPFGQTRRYIESVLFNQTAYAQQNPGARKQLRLSELFTDVGAIASGRSARKVSPQIYGSNNEVGIKGALQKNL